MIPKRDSVRLLELTLEQYTAQHVIPNATLVAYPDVASRAAQMVIQAVRKVPVCNCTEVISVPLTWWDAVKERFAPKWFTSRWPIAYRKIHAKAIFNESLRAFPEDMGEPRIVLAVVPPVEVCE